MAIYKTEPLKNVYPNQLNKNYKQFQGSSLLTSLQVLVELVPGNTKVERTGCNHPI